MSRWRVGWPARTTAPCGCRFADSRQGGIRIFAGLKLLGCPVQTASRRPLATLLPDGRA